MSAEAVVEQGTDTQTTEVGEQQPIGGGESTASTSATATDTAAQPQQAEKEPEYEFDMPEGVDLDKQAADEFKAIAKELKLPADAAKKIVALEVKRIEAQRAEHERLVEEWGSQVRSDTELAGPDGKAFDANIGVARSAIDKFGSPALKEFLNSTGLGNHPEVVKMAYRIGKALAEDSFVRGGAPQQSAARGAITEDQLASSLYPTMKRT